MMLEVVTGLGISYFLLFLLSIILKDNSIADVFWGLAFLQIAIHSFYLSKTTFVPQILFLTVIILWSSRISTYILSKKLKKKGEDRRYKIWRETWKFFYSRSFFQVYVLQGVLAFIIATPILVMNSSPLKEMNNFFIIGLAIALCGLLYESIADLQLKGFVKHKKKGEIMTRGLWKYSRHPNYFGESVFWFGICVATMFISPYVWASWILITFLLRFISGVPLAEQHYENNKAFIEYKKKTPPMIPKIF